jgi:tetratricopeptide (TPR) repeat protein
VTILLLHAIRQIGLIFLIVIIWGCTAPAVKAPVEKDFSLLAEKYRTKAVEYEKSGELRRALQSWEIVGNLIPADAEAAKKTSDIKQQILDIADRHFKQGLSYYKSNSIQAARKEFLLALIHNPDHKEALYYVKQKLTGEDYILYEVRKGDTLREIAKKKYNDPRKDFLIAYFNDTGKDAKLEPNTTLKLPVLEFTPTKKAVYTGEISSDNREMAVDVKQMISKANGYYKAKNYKETASLTAKILEYDPANKEARNLNNASYYQMGKILSQKKDYQEALAMFNHVDAGYKDVRESIAVAKKHLADTHYIKGVKYFTDEELDKAIKEWEITLTLDPHHPKAKKDIENARNLLKKLKEIE